MSEKVNGRNIVPTRYVTTDTMLQNCQGIRMYDSQVPETNVSVFSKSDILLSNIRPYLKKLWLADFDGACSNDVLVMRNKNTDICNTEFVVEILKQQEFFDFVMQDVNGAKMPRGKKAHIMDYKLYLPDMEEQKHIMLQVSELERKISTLEEKLKELSGRTSEIVKSYLM